MSDRTSLLEENSQQLQVFNSGNDGNEEGHRIENGVILHDGFIIIDDF